VDLPGVVRRIALLVAVEGVALVLVGVVYAVVSATGRPENRLAAELAAFLAVVFGLLLGLMARLVDGGRSWPRSPLIVLNIIALPVGLGLIQGGLYAAGLPVLLLAGAVLYLLATPDARQALGSRE
jgi:hypothetical protein